MNTWDQVLRKCMYTQRMHVMDYNIKKVNILASCQSLCPWVSISNNVELTKNAYKKWNLLFYGESWRAFAAALCLNWKWYRCPMFFAGINKKHCNEILNFMILQNTEKNVIGKHPDIQFFIDSTKMIPHTIH